MTSLLTSTQNGLAFLVVLLTFYLAPFTACRCVAHAHFRGLGSDGGGGGYPFLLGSKIAQTPVGARVNAMLKAPRRETFPLQHAK